MRRALPPLLAVLLVLGFITPVTAASTVRGIDVSQWQGVVDWATVASTATRFVIVRTTKGTDLVDPTFAANLAGATDAGLVVGAYHRATPSAEPGDARAEADFFLSVARNAPGDLLPALDIEETGGLTPPELVDWVRTWVQRVRNRLGVRSLLYASPYFWRTNMGDSTWFADRDYPLWIAHWNVAAPDVPAGSWSGRGWAVWQWTATGRVSGIDTDVDRDRVEGDLDGVRIASLTLTPSEGGSVTGPKLACGGAADRCTRLANPGDELPLTAVPDEGAVFLGWTGACAEAGASPTCAVVADGDLAASAVFGYEVGVTIEGSGAGSVSSDPAGLACPGPCVGAFPAGTSVQLLAVPDSASAFVSWDGACAGPGPSCTLSVSGPLTASARFDATTVLGEEGTGTSYGWGRSADPAAIGGSYRWERETGATVSFAFSGPAVTVFVRGGPSMGKARLSVDGAPVATMDAYARVTGTASRRLTGLGSGEHVLSLTVLGTKRAAATGVRVAPDALRFGGVLVENPAPLATTWGTRVDGAASDGTYVRSRVPGAAARLTFTGTGVTLRTVMGPSMGEAEIWVDGVLVRTVSLGAPTIAFVGRTVTGLPDNPHTVRVVVVGGGALVVDGWVVR